MIPTMLPPSKHVFAEIIAKLERGEALLPHSEHHVTEVVGVLKSYGVVLDAYSVNLIHIADTQFLVLFPFFKYFNGEVDPKQLLDHLWHDRINYEYAEYCMKAMMWHGGGGLADYIETEAFSARANELIAAAVSPPMKLLHRLFPDFLPEQLRQSIYYSALGQFWRVMADMFLELSDRYDRGDITMISDVVDHIRDGLVAAAGTPITYAVEVRGKTIELLPKSLGLTFLMDTAVPYVEAVFFRGTPFPGTISYNAQELAIPASQEEFAYGALYADPLPIGGSGIPPTLLMQDMRHYLPSYLQAIYDNSPREGRDLRVLICESFQKSMFCVTTAAIQGLAPHPLTTMERSEQEANRRYLEGWMDKFVGSQLEVLNP
jgi:CO2 hydration protein